MMLNWIWATLIVSSFLFAIGYDISDLSHNKYRNGQPLPVHLEYTQGADPAARSVPVTIRIDSAEYASFYGTPAKVAPSYTGYLRRTGRGTQLRFDTTNALPEPLKTIAKVSQSRDKELQGRIVNGTNVLFEPVRFLKLNAIAAAALDFAKTAAELALGLVGVLALFMGMLKIAEDAGVIYSLVRITRPILRPLSPRYRRITRRSA